MKTRALKTAALAPQSWASRSRADGVLFALNFGDLTQAQINKRSKSRPPSAQYPGEEEGQVWPRRDDARLSYGRNPSLRFDWTASPCRDSSKGSAPRGIFCWPLTEDGSFKFGPEREIYVQVGFYCSSTWIADDGTHFPTGTIPGGMKLWALDYGAGGRKSLPLFITNGEDEFVIQDNNWRGLLAGYNGNVKDQSNYTGRPIYQGRAWEPGTGHLGNMTGDILLQPACDCRYTRDRIPNVDPYSGAPYYRTPPCQKYRPGWNVITAHFKKGAKPYYFSDGDYREEGLVELSLGQPGSAPVTTHLLPWDSMWDIGYQGGISWPTFSTDLAGPNGYRADRPYVTLPASTSGQRVFPVPFPIRYKGDLRVDVNNPKGPDGPWGKVAAGPFPDMFGGPFGTVPWEAYELVGAGANPQVVFKEPLPPGTVVTLTELFALEKFLLFPFDYTHNCDKQAEEQGHPERPKTPHPEFGLWFADIIASTKPIAPPLLETGGAVPMGTYDMAGPGVAVARR